MRPPSDTAPLPQPLAATDGLRDRMRLLAKRLLADSGLDRLDIRWRFRVVVCAFGTPFLAYIVWAAAQQALLEKDHVRERARASAVLVATRFEDHIQQIDRLLSIVGQSVGPHLNDVPEITALIQGMRGNLPMSVNNVAVWTMAGEPVTALDHRSVLRGFNVADRQYFKDAVKRRDLGFEGPVRSRSTDVDIIQFARPIFNERDEAIAVLTMSIRTSALIDQLDPEGLIAKGALVTIFNDAGRIVARSAEPEAYVGKQTAELDGIADAFANRSGTREETSVDGLRRLAGYAVVGKWPWIVMVGEPIEKVLGPVSARLLRNLGVGLAILVVALLIAGRVGAWTSRPLIQLAADAERLGRGELAHRSAVVTGGEIAALAANFNLMAEALEQRERAIAARKAQLRAIADNIPEQITYVDGEQRYRFVNAQPGRFKNVARESMIGKTVREVRGEEVYQELLPSFRRAMAGESFTAEQSVTRDGRTAHYYVAHVPAFDEKRQVVGVYTFAQDVTERKVAELRLIESEKRLATITDNLPAMICYVDEMRVFRFANRAYEKWLEQPIERIVGQPFDRMMSPELAAQFDYYFLRGMQGESLEYELEIPTERHGARWLLCNFIPDIDEADGKVRGIYGMIHNVTKAKRSEQRLTRLAQFDTLTGLANRHQFNETFERLLADNDRDGRPLALMFLDIDHFKQVNDRHGHVSGDLLLKEFAQRLADCVRPTDAVARLSGDEFVVLLEGMHADDEPQFIARKIIAAVEKPFVLDEHFVRVSTSIGIAMRRHGGESSSALMKRADEALYEAKRSGRNTFRLAG